jgi:tRNA (adenine57-N1/adenine58-N1)-methyltransferase
VQDAVGAGIDDVGTSAVGAALKRGAFRAGDTVQLTDPKGRMNTIELRPGSTFHTHRGYFRHEDLIGKPEGWVITNTEGVEYLCLRPLYADYVMSMPRGAQVVYPKDAGQIIQMADIYPGARVLEAGVGSGALTMALLRAVGDHGRLTSIERRSDFATIARANVENFFGGPHPAWEVRVGDFADQAAAAAGDTGVDRVVLDMLAPWENIEAVADVLVPGGVFLAYVATVTQLSRLAEDLRAHGGFTEPNAWESMVRGWHLQGLAVRPDHRMVAHTGFLLTVRRLAPGVKLPERRLRVSKEAAVPGSVEDAPWLQGEFTGEDVGERPVSAKKVRRTMRALNGAGPHGAVQAATGQHSAVLDDAVLDDRVVGDTVRDGEQP